MERNEPVLFFFVCVCFFFFCFAYCVNGRKLPSSPLSPRSFSLSHTLLLIPFTSTSLLSPFFPLVSSFLRRGEKRGVVCGGRGGGGWVGRGGAGWGGKMSGQVPRGVCVACVGFEKEVCSSASVGRQKQQQQQQQQQQGWRSVAVAEKNVALRLQRTGQHLYKSASADRLHIAERVGGAGGCSLLRCG